MNLEILMLIIYRLQQHHLTYLCIPFTHCIKKTYQFSENME